jgi:hypothetical protein
MKPAIHCSHDEVVKIDTLVPHPRNDNTHPPEQIALYGKIIKHAGWRRAVTVSNRSGYVTKGHGALEAAAAEGITDIPIDKQDYATEADEYADMIADNRLAELAVRDRERTKDLLEEMDTGGFDMDLTGYSDKVLEGMMTAAADFDPALMDIQGETPESGGMIILNFGDDHQYMSHWRDRLGMSDSQVTIKSEQIRAAFDE